MACTSYNNNANAQIEFSMSTLPGGFCPAGYQALFDAIAQYLIGVLPGNYSSFLIKDSEPDPTDRDKLWVSVDTDCKPIGFFLYNTTYSAWLPVGQRVYNLGTAGGTANALTATADPQLSYLYDGALFILKAGTAANSGATTLNVSSLGVLAVNKEGNQALEGGEILPNKILLLNYQATGTYFELLNPSPAAASLAPEFRVINGSFEVDSDADGQPDNWTFTAIGSGTGAINSTVTAHGMNSYAVTVSASGGGTLAYDTTIPFCGDTGSGEVLVVSFWHRTTDAATTDIATIEWYDEAGVSVSGPTTLWDPVTDTITRPTNSWIRIFIPVTLPDTTARFFKIRLVGGSTGAATGTVYFDGVMVETLFFKRRVEYRYNGAAATAQFTFVPPTGVTMARVTCIGPGGGGASGNAGAATNGGGGGGGGTAVGLFPCTPGTTYDVVVGTGGAISTTGTDTTFDGGTITGAAGGGAPASPTVTGGTGGAGTVSSPAFGWTYAGANGTDGSSGAPTKGGDGGCAYGGGGGGKGVDGAAGNAGSDFGGGGGGGSRIGSAAGGVGGKGYVLIEF